MVQQLDLALAVAQTKPCMLDRWSRTAAREKMIVHLMVWSCNTVRREHFNAQMRRLVKSRVQCPQIDIRYVSANLLFGECVVERPTRAISNDHAIEGARERRGGSDPFSGRPRDGRRGAI